MNSLTNEIQLDVERINNIAAVPSILDIICRTTGMGFAAIARVTDTAWVACSVKDDIGFGLKPGGELKLETTICDEIRQTGNRVIIDHVAESEEFCGHHTPEMYGFQSYISIPIIRKDGSFFGTLCAIDPKPRQLNDPHIISMFELYAELISFHLETLERLTRSQQQLKEEKYIADLREQFIAILGHDLKNPIAAISSSAQLLLRMNKDEKAFKLASIISESSYRVKGLVDNLLDFARGRLGEGIQLTRTAHQDPHIFLDQVISELKVLWPDAVIETRFNLQQPVSLDSKRVSQLFSNLLANALSYGKLEHPVVVEAVAGNKIFSLSVSNAADQIPESSMRHLFHPFSRGKVKQGQDGLGLGLFIASEIAKAHDGDLTVTSDAERTTFQFKMPLQ